MERGERGRLDVWWTRQEKGKGWRLGEEKVEDSKHREWRKGINKGMWQWEKERVGGIRERKRECKR